MGAKPGHQHHDGPLSETSAHGTAGGSTHPHPHPHDEAQASPADPAGHAHPHARTGGHAHPHDGAGGHGHPHDDGAAHGHAHGSGVVGWLRSTFGHSHAAADRIDSSMETHERGMWALKISLVGLGLTAAFQLVVVFISHSVALLADTIHNFGDALTSLPLWVAFALIRRGTSRRFTYGYGKVEDVAGLVIVAIIFFSACVAAYESVRKLIHPEPLSNAGWVALAAVIGFLGNEAVAVFRIRVGREIGSAALVADGQHARVDGFTSLAVLIGVAGVWLGVPILDPLVGLGITIAILFIVRDAVRTVWLHLVEGIEPEILGEIEHAPTHVSGVRRVREARARWIGHRVHGDVVVEVDPGLSVREGDAVAEEVERALRDHVPLLGTATVRVAAGEAAATVPPTV